MEPQLVSVIIPTYNRAEYLKQAIESVLAQTYTHFELLILDNCSPDHTPEVVAQFSDPRIKYLRHQCNIGSSANWTYGIYLAKGSFLSFLADDDIYGCDFLSHRLKSFSTDRFVVAVTGAFVVTNERKEFLRASRIPEDTTVVFQGDRLLSLALGLQGEWFNGATLYSTYALRSVFGKSVMAGKVGDYSMHIRLAMKKSARLIFLSDQDVTYRFHAGQDSQENIFHVGEDGAKLALQMWMFDITDLGHGRQLFRRRFAQDINHHARMLWDNGRIKASRKMFLWELFINPFRPLSWARLVRACLKHEKKNV